ncbi:MliC family protein [Methylobacterium sp. A54F]
MTITRHASGPLLAAALTLGLARIAAAAEEPEKVLAETVQSELAQTRRVIFVCPKDQLLTVEFLNSEPGKPAIVRPPGGAAVTLPEQLSGSGFRYADDTHELRGKGQEVTWTDAAQPPVVCTEQTPTPLGTEPK